MMKKIPYGGNLFISLQHANDESIQFCQYTQTRPKPKIRTSSIGKFAGISHTMNTPLAQVTDIKLCCLQDVSNLCRLGKTMVGALSSVCIIVIFVGGTGFPPSNLFGDVEDLLIFFFNNLKFCLSFLMQELTLIFTKLLV